MPDAEGHSTAAELEAHRKLLDTLIAEAIALRQQLTEQLKRVRRETQLVRLPVSKAKRARKSR